jgi:hypothetical protein
VRPAPDMARSRVVGGAAWGSVIFPPYTAPGLASGPRASRDRSSFRRIWRSIRHAGPHRSRRVTLAPRRTLTAPESTRGLYMSVGREARGAPRFRRRWRLRGGRGALSWRDLAIARPVVARRALGRSEQRAHASPSQSGWHAGSADHRPVSGFGGGRASRDPGRPPPYGWMHGGAPTSVASRTVPFPGPEARHMVGRSSDRNRGPPVAGHASAHSMLLEDT